MTRAVLTREVGFNDGIRNWVPNYFDVVEVPLTTTVFRPSEVVHRELDEAVTAANPQWLVLTSRRGATALRGWRVPAGLRVAAVGQITAQTLHDVGIDAALVGGAGAGALADDLDGSVLVVGAAERHDELSDVLRARGRAITSVVAYETEPTDLTDENADQIRRADVLFIGAPSAWRVAAPFVAQATWVVVPGQTTSEVVSAQHTRVVVGWDGATRDRLGELFPEVH